MVYVSFAAQPPKLKHRFSRLILSQSMKSLQKSFEDLSIEMDTTEQGASPASNQCQVSNLASSSNLAPDQPLTPADQPSTPAPDPPSTSAKASNQQPSRGSQAGKNRRFQAQRYCYFCKEKDNVKRRHISTDCFRLKRWMQAQQASIIRTGPSARPANDSRVVNVHLHL